MTSRLGAWLAVLIGLHLGACVAQQPLPPSVLVPLAGAGVKDARAEFERILCAINEDRGKQFPDFRPCDQILASLGAAPSFPAIAPRAPCCFTLVFVPGIFGECVAHLGTPFSDSYARLTAAGHAVHVVPVRGRASSAHNAALIARYLSEREAALGDVILIGYSKGVTDILESLAANRDAGWAKKVRAVVSVAGVVAGSPIADRLDKLYDSLLSKLPWATCPAVDGGGVDSLTRSARIGFLERNPLPEGIKFYSLSAIARQGGINPLLAGFHQSLLSFGPNDGQVVIHDAVIPGSFLLAYLNGDHWAVAVPFNRSASIDAALLRIQNAFPREVLIDAILGFIAGTLD